jgi:hypothetical protein
LVSFPAPEIKSQQDHYWEITARFIGRFQHIPARFLKACKQDSRKVASKVPGRFK